MRAWLVAGLLLCLPMGARADQGPIQVQHAWSRPAMAGHDGVIYLSITNHGAPDRLLGASSPAAARTELHETFDDHGVRRVRRVASLAVPSGRTLTFQPGGYRITLLDLRHALTAGDSVPVTLTFQKAGDISAVAMVERRGAMAAQHTEKMQ